MIQNKRYEFMILSTMDSQLILNALFFDGCKTFRLMMLNNDVRNFKDFFHYLFQIKNDDREI